MTEQKKQKNSKYGFNPYAMSFHVTNEWLEDLSIFNGDCFLISSNGITLEEDGALVEVLPEDDLTGKDEIKTKVFSRWMGGINDNRELEKNEDD